jgi:hypothetical protein
MSDVEDGSVAAELHQPEPGGRCRECGAHWPCTVKRVELLAEFDDARSSLLIYLSLHLIDALKRSTADSAAAQLYEQYLGWVPGPDGAGDDFPVEPSADRNRYAGDGKGSRHEARAA